MVVPEGRDLTPFAQWLPTGSVPEQSTSTTIATVQLLTGMSVIAQRGCQFLSCSKMRL